MKSVIMSLATESDAVGNSYEHKKEKSRRITMNNYSAISRLGSI